MLGPCNHGLLSPHHLLRLKTVESNSLVTCRLLAHSELVFVLIFWKLSIATAGPTRCVLRVLGVEVGPGGGTNRGREEGVEIT